MYIILAEIESCTKYSGYYWIRCADKGAAENIIKSLQGDYELYEVGDKVNLNKLPVEEVPNVPTPHGPIESCDVVPFRWVGALGKLIKHKTRRDSQ